MTDFFIQNEGSIFLLQPLSDAGKEWVKEHIGDDAQTLGDAVVIEHRYIGAIVDGVQADGLSVE